MRFWDTVAKRYSCPFSLLDGFISTCSFSSFVKESWKLSQHDFLYEFWLHKVNDGKSFNDFKQKLEERPVIVRKEMTEEEIRRTISENEKLLTQYKFKKSGDRI